MLSSLSRSPGIGGSIKSAPEDFLVEEIAPDGTVYGLGEQISYPNASGQYVHFILQKTDWSTSSAISEIAKRLRTSQSNFNFAGSKDKVAITTQLASVRGSSKEALSGLKIKDISINGVWSALDRVHLGDLLGNRFTITVRGACDDAASRIGVISAELDGKMPNYFGEQRFGSTRNNTHTIGMMLLRGEVGEAVRSFLCDSDGEEHAEAKLARKELADTSDYGRALSAYPRHLRLERSMLAYLAKKPNDPAGALRCLPRHILLLFVHAVQSHVFNNLLSERLAESKGTELSLEAGEFFCGESFGFPDTSKTEAEGWIAGKLIGYNTPVNEREQAVLDALGIKKEDFRMKSLPELSAKGSYRTLLAPLKDFSFDGSFRFSLPSGSYATVAMREFMKN